jgi:hypothetical protein
MLEKKRRDVLFVTERSGASKVLVWSKHICIFIVHVFHEVFYSQTFLRSFQGTGSCWQRFGVDFDFSKNGMWFKVDGVLGILKECCYEQYISSFFL